MDQKVEPWNCIHDEAAETFNNQAAIWKKDIH